MSSTLPPAVVELLQNPAQMHQFINNARNGNLTEEENEYLKILLEMQKRRQQVQQQQQQAAALGQSECHFQLHRSYFQTTPPSPPPFVCARSH